MPADIPSHPILSPEAAAALEKRLFAGDERAEWKAMAQAGVAVASAALGDMEEAGGFPAGGRILLLAGKGNNAGDAFIAARDILGLYPGSSCDVLLAFGQRGLKSQASKAWRGLSEAGRGRVRAVTASEVGAAYDLCLDGIFGYQFRPPLPPGAVAAVAAADRADIRLRAAVDLPSGLNSKGAFSADFTYATGVAKAPLLSGTHAGRPRYLDLGFFEKEAPGAPAGADRVLLPSILRPLAGLRPFGIDKRTQGHLALVGGSEGYPGAILMAALAALRSGVGLLTVFVPKALAAAYAARAPEAMWVGMPETKSGALSAAGLRVFHARAGRATALAMGPGCGRDPGTHALLKAIARASKVPFLVDADGLQPDIVRTGKAPRILTPHAGELERIARGAELRPLARSIPAVIVAKGPVTRVCAGGPAYHSFLGGPVLSRGGSGDVLAGLTGGLLAQTPHDPMLAACRAVTLHGMAADLLARARGQAAVDILQLLDFLSPALRCAGSGRRG
ncbi:MAG TPA: NAD(P)H-hydrate dehydratase [Opitutaceae bacterium]